MLFFDFSKLDIIIHRSGKHGFLNHQNQRKRIRRRKMQEKNLNWTKVHYNDTTILGRSLISGCFQKQESPQEIWRRQQNNHCACTQELKSYRRFKKRKSGTNTLPRGTTVVTGSSSDRNPPMLTLSCQQLKQNNKIKKSYRSQIATI